MPSIDPCISKTLGRETNKPLVQGKVTGGWWHSITWVKATKMPYLSEPACGTHEENLSDGVSDLLGTGGRKDLSLLPGGLTFPWTCFSFGGSY